MMCLCEVQHAAGVLESRLAGTILQRIVQADDLRLILEFYGQASIHRVLLSCQPSFARVSVLADTPATGAAPRAFAQYLRAHCGRARFGGVQTSPADRRIGIRLTSQACSFEIVLSILGPRSNLYLLDQAGVLLVAMRPLETTRRDLVLGSAWRDPEGSPRSAGTDRWASVPDSEYLEAVEATYAALERTTAAEALARRLGQALQKEADFLDRKAFNMLQDLGEAMKAEEYRQKGELLKLALHSIRTGDESVTVTDYQSGEPVVIALNPRLSAAENLAAYFKRYQKELRGAGALSEQLQIVRKAQEDLAGLARRLDALVKSAGHDLEALQGLAAEPRARKLLSRHDPVRRHRALRPQPPSPGGKDIPARLLPKRYRTEQGLEIWVGRNDDGNDYLTTRLARGNDLFFHLEGYPGSHVILRTEGRSDPPPQAVLDACELAVHFSQLKSARRADVHVAPIKAVRKPKGAKPGLVQVMRGKTIHLRRDPKRLESILAARLDE